MLLLPAIANLGFGSPAIAADRISWFVTHFPPGYIRVGENIGTGHMDRLLDHFQKGLTGFNHLTVDGPLTRALASMRRSDGVCNNGVFKKPEREEYVAFSKPYVWIVSNRLIVAEDAMAKVAPHVGADGVVNVEILLNDAKIRFGFGKSRSYAPVVDNTLKALAGDPRGQAVIHSETLMKMIAGGRFDVTFAYPTEATHQLRRLGLTPKLRYFPMANVARFFPVHVGCSKKPIGKRVIAEVNKIISAAGAYPAWYRHYEKNLSPDAVKELRAFVPTAGKQ